MERRDFFKILSASSAGLVAGGCGKKTDQLIPLLVREYEIAPGEEQWHPSVCTECAAGCGTVARVMAATRTVERNGEEVRQPIGAIKKVEGNPLDPVSGGRLCARGQAAVQALYHPERLQGPRKRTGDRGKAQFAPTTWAEALAMAADRIGKAHAADPNSIVVLTGPQAGTHSVALERFTRALGAPAPVVCSLAAFPAERKAAELVFGWKGLPVYDLANARYAVGVGADFLGGWTSPVYYSRQFGAFRQGRRDVRGYLVQAESRLSLTASSADQWLPLQPGSEPQFLAAVGHLLLELKLAHHAEQVPPSVLEVFQSVDVKRLLAGCGVAEARVRTLVRELGESEAPLVIAGASILQTNSLDAVAASHYVNLMLGNVGRKGGLLAPAPSALAPADNHRVAEALAHAKVVLLDDVNPVYTMPTSSGVTDLLAKAETVISIGNFLDDSGAWSDLLLPVHHSLESEIAVSPAVSAEPAIQLAAAFVEPLYDTRSHDAILADLAHALKVEYQPVNAKDIVQPLLAEGTTFEDAVRQGGFWREPEKAVDARATGKSLEIGSATFAGDAEKFPLLFQPYPSLQFGDGRGANLPWLQELPDPASSAIWGLPVEIDPKTAAQLRVANGDLVRIESPHGAIDAAAYVHPGALPGVASMPVGGGHNHFGGYAGRGANPLAILAPVWEKSTGALVLGGTRVRLARLGPSKSWIQFAAPDREQKEWGHR
jgi:anaerobic selenocysteine-containing dehydrogenase